MCPALDRHPRARHLSLTKDRHSHVKGPRLLSRHDDLTCLACSDDGRTTTTTTTTNISILSWKAGINDQHHHDNTIHPSQHLTPP